MPLNNPFLKATPLYKEYAILELLSKNPNVTQRIISKELDSSLSMVNQYLEEYGIKGLIKRNYFSPKRVEYTLTKKGSIRLRELNIRYFKSVRSIYTDSKDLVIKFLNEITNKGFKNILMYGAGEVAQLILQVLFEETDVPVKILALVDDDEKKVGYQIFGIKIISNDEISKYKFDGILVSSDVHGQEIRDKIFSLGYNKEIIINFFE